MIAAAVVIIIVCGFVSVFQISTMLEYLFFVIFLGDLFNVFNVLKLFFEIVIYRFCIIKKKTKEINS